MTDYQSVMILVVPTIIALGIGNVGPIDLGMDRQLLCDSSVISESNGLNWTVNPPVPVDTVLWPDEPWEDWTLSYFSLLEDNGLYRMWYGAYQREPLQRRICYAESSDGVIWEKPIVGLVEFEGSFDNNILPINVTDGGYTFIDPLASASGKYKFVGTSPLPTLYESHDGIHWVLVDTALLDLFPDTQNQVFFDERIDTYVAYLRSWNWLEEYDSMAVPNRTVSRLEVSNPSSFWNYTPIDSPFYHWGPLNPPAISTELDIVMKPDTLDPADVDIYNPCVIEYGGAANAYFAFPSIYHHYEPPPAGNFVNDGVLEIQVAFSRDGINWSRYRTTYVDNEFFGDSLRQLYMSPAMLKIGGNYYQYFIGIKESHGDSLAASRYYCVRQRIDGFVSLKAEGQVADLRTVPLTFEGNTLLLNYSMKPGGYLVVSVNDSLGNEIPGFSVDDCDTLRDDQTAGPVSWKDRRDVSMLEGSTVSLAFELRDADLYAFQFDFDPTLDVDPTLLVANDWSLSQNYPNPFNPATTIPFSIASRSDVDLSIFNVLGQHVATLVNEPFPAGEHQVVWDGTDTHGGFVTSGVYFYRLRVGESISSKKMLLLR